MQMKARQRHRPTSSERQGARSGSSMWIVSCDAVGNRIPFALDNDCPRSAGTDPLVINRANIPILILG
jgi:hypothetical protein